jgi:hypothetical protein
VNPNCLLLLSEPKEELELKLLLLEEKPKLFPGLKASFA